MSARFLVGDVRQRMAELDDGSFDLICCSPPFWALRSYLPEGHPEKHLEIGSEAGPAEFLDTMLALTAEWGRLLAPHGSIAIELGDTYCDGDTTEEALAKSLLGIPQLYQIAITYGINPLTCQPSPAGRWRVRNLKAWIRSNPPVGALGDKERPATSYIIVATRAVDRWFDLDAVRTTPAPANRRTAKGVDQIARTGKSADRDGNWSSLPEQAESGGAPPRDWIHTVDLILDTELANRAAGKPNGSHTIRKRRDSDGNDGIWGLNDLDTNITTGAQGVHLRRALEHAGILQPQDFYDISPKGYRGAHYAVWPPELARRLIDEMCPRHVCVTCGEPRRRLTETTNALGVAAGRRSWREGGTDGVGAGHVGDITVKVSSAPTAQRETVGWSDCGHNTWRPGRVLDPFVGSGTTLAVATGMARDSVGIDLDYTNVGLAMERVGMWLDVAWPPGDLTLPALGAGHPGQSYAAWPTDQDAEQILAALVGMFHQGTRPRERVIPTRYDRPAPPAQMPGQVDLFGDPTA